MKSIHILVFSFISFFITAAAFSQDLTDQEIGFDEARIMLFLQERGIKNPEDFNKEISHLREKYREQYVAMKKSDEELLLRVPQKQLLKATVDIPQSEKDALKALYDSTNGDNWVNKTGWDFSTPVTSWNSTTNTGWYGLYVQNGHVISISTLSNNLKGTLPKEIGQLKYLTTLRFQTENLSGNIPKEIGQLENLEILSFILNKLSGTIPEEIYNLKKLSDINLSFNTLSGPISPAINKLTNLIYLNCSYNQLTGNIIPEIGQLSNLVNMDLSSNLLTDTLPLEIGGLQKLVSINLYNNQINGNIPKEILVSRLKTLNLSSNRLTGIIPLEIKTLPNITTLNIANNLLEGSIPDVSNLPSLTSFFIYNNKFRFIDFASQFSLYQTKMGSKFMYYPQAKTDTAKSISGMTDGSAALTMCDDNRFTLEDTFQWYKNSSLIAGATSRVYTITNLKTTDAGNYFCKSSHPNNPDISSLVLERETITLKVENCTPTLGTIKIAN